MPVRTAIPLYYGVYFITLTCCRWKNLFEEADGYAAVYKWFDYLRSCHHFILGYVIMPNHLHVVIGFRHTQGVSINKIIGTGKRFMAYELVKKLKQLNKHELLSELKTFVNKADRKKDKLHEVFEPSFDWKDCYNETLIEQKLTYMHENPIRGKWNLAAEVWDYVHSSAKQYLTHENGIYPITPYSVLNDVDLTKHFVEG